MQSEQSRMQSSQQSTFKIPLTRELLRSAKMTYASYIQRLDRDKEEKERQLKQKELAKAEKKQTRKRRRR